MIIFTKIYLEGFGSFITRKKFKLLREGLNIVIAKNGSGKTTVWSGLAWAIRGKALKDSNSIGTWKHKQPSDYKGTFVELCFKKGVDKYSIIRMKDYKDKVFGSKGGDRLVIVKNGEPLKFKNKAETQEELYKILGFTGDLLVNSVIFGQRMKRLIETSGPEKKRVFEEAFSATFLQLSLDRAKEDYKLMGKELIPLQDEAMVLKERKSNLKDLLESEKKNLKARQAAKQERIDALTESLAHVNAIKKVVPKKVKPDKKKVKALEKCNLVIQEAKTKADYIERDLNKREKEYTRLKIKLENIIDDANNEITNLRESSKCPTCGTVIKDQSKIEDRIKTIEATIRGAKLNLKEEKAKYKKLLKKLGKRTMELAKEANKLARQRDELEADISSITKKNDYRETIIRENRMLQEMSDKYSEQLADAMKIEVKTEKTQTKSKYLKTKNRLKEISPIIKRMAKDYDNLRWVINDLLSNKGLKAFIFDKMLAQLNEKLRYYEQFIGFRVEFAVDLEGGNKDIYAVCYDGKNMIYYEDLSGGEKQKVDAATAFALHDLVSVNRPANLLVFDEPFEGLDAENVEVVSDLINDKANGRCVFLVSHNLAMQNSSTKVIRMSKDKKGDTLLKVL